MKAAFFDLDGTVLTTQSQKLLIRELSVRGHLSPIELFCSAIWFLLYRLGFISSSVQARARLYSIIGRIPPSDFENIISAVVIELKSKCIRPSIKKRIDDYLKAGVPIVVITGTLANICQKVCESLGISQWHATELGARRYSLNQPWIGNVYEGAEKANLVRKIAMANGYDLEICSCYADSFTDVPMLELFGEPVAVSPDRKLANYAKLRNWKVLKG